MRRALIPLLAVSLVAPLASSAPAAIRPGDILVADQTSTADSGAVIGIDPRTGHQRTISDNAISDQDLFEGPEGIALTRKGTIMISDYESQAIIRVNPRTGQQSLLSNNLVSDNDFFGTPNHIAIDTAGSILVADDEGTSGEGALVRVNPRTGQQSLVSDNAASANDLFSQPWGVIVEPRGSLLVSDYETDLVARVVPATGQQTEVVSNATSNNDLFQFPTGIAPDGPDRILVTDFTVPSLIAARLSSGEQVLVSDAATSQNDLFSAPVAVALDSRGRILVADQEAGNNDGAVIR